MASDVAKAFESLPGWVIPATIGGVVLLALFSQKSASSGGYNSVVYGPQPSDPGLVGLAAKETEAKQAVIQTFLSGTFTRDIAGIESERDVTLGGINASTERQRINAQENVAITNSNNQAATARYQTDTAKAIGLGQQATSRDVARVQSKQSFWGSLFGGIAKIFS